MLPLVWEHQSDAVAEQIADIHFRELMSDPVSAIKRTYEQIAMPFPDEMAESVLEYLTAMPEGKFGPHRYEPSHLGLDETTLLRQLHRPLQRPPRILIGRCQPKPR